MKNLIFCLVVSVLGGLQLKLCAETAEKRSPVSVSFLEPEKFTDVKEEWGAVSVRSDARREAVLDELKQYLEKTAPRYLSAGQLLEIKITDIDLAGDFEPWRGANFDDIRIVKDIYPPRVSLEYRLMAADGSVIREARRELRDLGYLMSVSMPTSDSLRYEKEMLRDWLAQEFKRPKK
jgi:hypothetical protein